MTESRTNGDARETAAAEAHEERRGTGPSRADLMKELDKLEQALEEARSASDEAMPWKVTVTGKAMFVPCSTGGEGNVERHGPPRVDVGQIVADPHG